MSDRLPPPSESPTVAGRWLAGTLKQLRLDNGLSRADLARELGCAASKIGHIETRVTPVRKADLLVMLGIYKVPAEEQVWYLDMCERAKRKGWWDGAPGIPDWFSALIGLEAGASEVRTFELSYIPGLLQTRSYMEAIFRDSTKPGPAVEEFLQNRIRRQGHLHEPEASLTLHAILDEASLRRAIGGSAVMREQLTSLAELKDHPRITVQVLSFGNGVPSGLESSFHRLRFEAASDPGLVYLETHLGGLYLEEEDEVEVYDAVFDGLAEAALTPGKSASMMRKIAKEF